MRLLSCPISSNIIDDNEFKIAGAVYIVLLTGYLFGGYVFLVGYTLVDIIMRLSPLGKSPVLFFSSIAVKLVKLKRTPRDESPTRFALMLGGIMLLLTMVTHTYSLDLLAFTISLNLVLLKLLDVVFDYCVGCKLYSILRNFL